MRTLVIMQGVGEGLCQGLTALQSLPSPHPPPKDGHSVESWVKVFNCCCSSGPHTPPGAGTLH